MDNKKSLLIGMSILLMIISSCIFANCLARPNIIAQLNNSVSIKDKQNELKTTPNNNSMSTAERQAIMQKGNTQKVGPVPDEPNFEPMCSNAL